MKDKSRTVNVKNGATWAVVSNVIGAVLPFFLRRIFIQNIGSELLGLNSLCTSILAVLNVVDFGITEALAFKLYKPFAEKDYEKVNQIYGYLKKIFRVLGTIIFTGGMIVLPFFERLYSNPISVNGRIVFFMYLLNIWMTYFFVSYNYLIFAADQRVDLQYKVISSGYVILYVLQMIMASKGNYYGYLVIMFVSTFGNLLLSRFFVRKYFPEVKAVNGLSKDMKMDVMKSAFSASIFKVRRISRTSLDSIVISFFLGLSILGVYQNYMQIISMCVLLRIVVMSAVAPSLGNYNIYNSKESTYSLSKSLFYFQMFISGWLATGFYFLVTEFIRLWVGGEFILDDQMKVIFSTYVFITGMSGYFDMMRQALGVWDKGRILAFIEMISNLVLNVALVNIIGLPGILLATIITILAINVPCDLVVIIKGNLNGKILDYFGMVFVNIIWVTISGVIISYIINKNSSLSLFQYTLNIVICFIIPPVIYAILFFRNEYVKAIFVRIRNII